MDFAEAIRLVKDGKRITKLEWGNANIQGFLHDGILSFVKEDGVIYQWIVSEGDIVGTDWLDVDMVLPAKNAVVELLPHKDG